MAALKKWSVSVPFHASVVVKVSAATEAEAIAKAIEESHPSLCHQCSDEIEMGEHNEDAECEAIEL